MSKPERHEKQLPVGTFRLGDENVDLYALPNSGEGGEFYLRPDDKSVGRIKVGIKQRWWDDVLAALLHESLEYLYCRSQVRFCHSQKFNYDHADYIFVFDHSTFGELISRQALFISHCYPKLHALWRKHRVKK